MQQFRRDLLPVYFALVAICVETAVTPETAIAQPAPAKRSMRGAQTPENRIPVDAKNLATSKAAPPADPALANYARYEKTAPKPDIVAPVPTFLPLALEPGARIAFIGNALFDRDVEFGHFETLLHQRYPAHQLVIRNLAWSADEIDLQPRPDNFATLEQHLTLEKADVIFAAFGFNESFAGLDSLPAFRERLGSFLRKLKTSAFNGQTGPRIILVSPIANENVPGIPAADLNNERLKAYTEAVREIAARENIAFADVFTATHDAMAPEHSNLTFNGIHMERAGYALFGGALYQQTFGEVPPPLNERLREAVIEKNRQYFRRYRPLNTFYYTGGRNKDYGYLDFLPAMRNFDLMVENRGGSGILLDTTPFLRKWTIQTFRRCPRPLKVEAPTNGCRPPTNSTRSPSIHGSR